MVSRQPCIRGCCGARGGVSQRRQRGRRSGRPATGCANACVRRIALKDDARILAEMLAEDVAQLARNGLGW